MLLYNIRKLDENESIELASNWFRTNMFVRIDKHIRLNELDVIETRLKQI